jgi:death-on-curing protein
LTEPIWISNKDAFALHEQQIVFFGGSAGVRDAGLLNSALAPPKNLLAYAEGPVTMAELAAAYAFGISCNHPFLDGNKRTAMHVAFVFLEFNGVAVRATPEDACLTFLGLAAGKISESELAVWFARNTDVG